MSTISHCIEQFCTALNNMKVHCPGCIIVEGSHGHLVCTYKGSHWHLAGQLSLQMSSLASPHCSQVSASTVKSVSVESTRYCIAEYFLFALQCIAALHNILCSWVILTDVSMAIKLSPPNLVEPVLKLQIVQNTKKNSKKQNNRNKKCKKNMESNYRQQ